MQFYYHMYGKDMGTLSLHQMYDAGLNDMIELWRISGNQGREWKKAEVTIPLAPSGEYFIVLFKGTVGGFTSDMAVDDIFVTTGACRVTQQPINPELIKCDFGESTECRWSQIEGSWEQFGVQLTDDFNWRKSRRSSNSETGPKADHTSGSGNYLYLPASSTSLINESIAGKSAWYATHLIYNKERTCMTFWYHMHGRDMGTLKLHQLYNAGLDSMVTLWEMTGDQGDEWKQARVSLPLAAAGEYYILLFQGTAGGILSDMAIDDVDVKQGECVQREDVCNFDEDPCTWTQVGDLTLAFGEKLNDDLDWTVTSGGTSSELTGPDSDHTTGSGFYMYLETSSPASQGDRAWFMSDVIVARDACLNFFYHMNGVNIGELKVYQLYSARQGNILRIWDKKGDQGNQWRKAQIDLPYVPGDTYRVLIEGVVGDGYAGDIAVDDIRYSPERCTDGGTGEDDTCTFEPISEEATTKDAISSCGWMQVLTDTTVFNKAVRDDLDWTLGKEDTPSGGTGPDGDHTPGKRGLGHFLYLEASSPSQFDDKAMIMSPVLNSQRSCLHFWYYMIGDHAGQLNVYQLDNRPDSDKRSLWQISGEQENLWKMAEVQVPDASGEFVLLIESVVGDGYQGDIAIDDVRWFEGDCQQAMAEHGEWVDLKRYNKGLQQPGIAIEVPAAFALFGGLALMAVLIIGLLIFSHKQRSRVFSVTTDQI